jgi:hypothetical protein
LLVLLNITGVPVDAGVRDVRSVHAVAGFPADTSLASVDTVPDVHSVHLVAGFPAATGMASLMFIPFMLLLAYLPLLMLASLMFAAFMLLLAFLP